VNISHAAIVQAVIAYFNDPQFSDFFVETECPIQMGSASRRADIVLRDGKGNFIAIAECKSSGGSDYGRSQLKSYLSASDTQFGLLAMSPNPDEWIFCERRGGNRFVEIKQAVFEARVLGESAKELTPESVEAGKPQSVRIWRYVAGILGMGLLISIILLLMHSNTPEQSVVQPSTPEQPAVHIIGEVALIPAGEFQMGGRDGDAESDEQPVHTVYVDAFYIDKYEVTNAQYKKFVDANPQWQKDNIPRNLHNGKYLRFWRGNTYHLSKENHPVVYVSWYAAMAYAKWAGKRLPTEAEWEKAARGGVVGRKYPWGDLIDSTKANYGRAVGKTMLVGTYPANDYDLYDMVGNVMEWCLDAYETDYYSRSSPRNPIAGDGLTDLVDNFQNVTSLRVVRSGCWYNAPMHVRIADRYGTSPDDASSGRGFRCAGSATSLSE
jgi:formylglycine-generating enzyme required for sulfatase activity